MSDQLELDVAPAPALEPMSYAEWLISGLEETLAKHAAFEEYCRDREPRRTIDAAH